MRRERAAARSFLITLAQASRRRRVIMNGADVRNVRVFPTVVVNHGALLIEQPSRRDHPLDESVLAWMILSELGETHALVHWNPGNDAGMIVIAPDCAPPFGRETLPRHRRPLTRVRHLFPNEKAEAVAPVEPARVFYLLMLTRAVEAETLRPFHVRAQGCIRRRGQQTLRPVALIQNHRQIGRLIV